MSRSKSYVEFMAAPGTPYDYELYNWSGRNFHFTQGSLSHLDLLESKDVRTGRASGNSLSIVLSVKLTKLLSQGCG